MNVDTSQLSRYGYDPRTRRYRETKSGRYISAGSVRRAVDMVIDTEAVKIRDLSDRLLNGTVSVAQWQEQTQHDLKMLHVAMGLAANGGLHNTSPADFGYLGSLIKKQYQFLHDFASGIARGQQALDGTLTARAQLYVQAARGTYEDMTRRAAGNAGVTQERRVLGLADSCQTCLSQAAMGWQPIGTLNAIGESECRSNCRCNFEYA